MHAEETWHLDHHSAKGHWALKMLQPKTLGLPSRESVLRGRTHTSITVACRLCQSMHVHCHKRLRGCTRSCGPAAQGSLQVVCIPVMLVGDTEQHPWCLKAI